ncbi:MAG: hypothetical protein ABIY48_03620 [Acidimicrobiales bacterium]
MLSSVAALMVDKGTLGGSTLASWTPLVALLIAYAMAVVALLAFGQPAPSGWGALQPLSRIPDSLKRLTGVPGWAAAAIGTALFGLLVAGQGFYADVSWHIALGRDKDLFTAPHASILIGLVLLVAGAVLGTLFATFEGVEPAVRVGALRIPPSLLPLWALGIGAVIGFPIDNVWHGEYGVDVTMWSPPHMLMILGATFTGLAAWLILAGAGVRPTDGGWARGLHVFCGWLTLQGLVAPQGEFAFGVPQFNALFSPILIGLAGGLALITMRIVLGRGWGFGIVAVNFLVLVTNPLGGGGGDPVSTRFGGTFLVSALAVEALAVVLGTTKTVRFAAASGLAIGTVGLAGEWVWNQDAYQPWSSAMAPEAVVFGTIGAIGAALLGVALARAIAARGDLQPVRGGILAMAAVMCLAVILIPMRRPTGDVTASIRTEPGATSGTAFIVATLAPTDAAEHASWFQAMAWQGGGLELADMHPTGRPGEYRSTKPIPVGDTVDGQRSFWKAMLRLHRGMEMMAVPLHLPADPDIHEAEISAVGTTAPFGSEKRYLLRETTDGNAWLSPAVHLSLVAVVALWALAFVTAVRSLDPRASRDRERPLTADV